VTERLGIPRENTVAFGDSPNDSDMIAYAGFGVVMGDGDPSVQALADYVTLPLSQCGVAHGLSRLPSR
jgi:hydroxymethylpyrimidine pyrophosphatase-like HAD family hydrolase